MLAANGSPHIFEPLQHMEEKPYKIVKNLKTENRKLFTKSKTIFKSRKAVKAKSRMQLLYSIKPELETSCNEDDEQDNIINSTNDPLFTPQIPQMTVKSEFDQVKFETDAKDEDEESEKFLNCDEDIDFCTDECPEEDEEDYKMAKRKTKSSKKRRERVVESGNDEENLDDKLHIKLQNKLVRKSGKKAPRLKDCQETCKHKCTTKYDKEQRLEIYHFYWQLKQEDQVNFLRTHIRKRVVKYAQSNSSRSCYFLKIYKLTDTNIFNPDDEELIKVCRKFFTGTLKISDLEIKEAFKDFELLPERIKQPIRDLKINDLTKLTQIVKKQQYLNPETGDLTDTKPKRKRNEPPPKRFPKPIKCALNCKFKCHEKFSEEERTQICDAFWSLDYQRRKDFVLSRLEVKDVKKPLNPEYRKTNRPTRSYQTKYFLRSGSKSENIRVCKHFMENTLNVHKCFIENAIEFSDKTTGAYTSFDRRLQNHKINADRLQTVLDHIASYPYWLPNKKSKTKYLYHFLTIRKMYENYKEKCLAQKMEIVSVNFYYKVFHKDFQILFLASPPSEKNRGFYKSNPNISQYTGNEPGGCWYDSNGTLLDLKNRPLNFDAKEYNESKMCDFKNIWNINPLNLVQNPYKTLANLESGTSSNVFYQNMSTEMSE